MKFYKQEVQMSFKMPAVIYMGESTGETSYYPLHWHDNIEFVLVLQGYMKGKINRKEVVINESELFFVNSEELHETRAIKNMYSITILISYDLFKEYCSDIEEYYFDLKSNKYAEKRIKALIYKCALIHKEKDDFYELEISILLREISLILLKECRKKREKLNYASYDKKSISVIKKAVSYMEKNYENNITLKDISDEIGMAPTYFARFSRIILEIHSIAI